MDSQTSPASPLLYGKANCGTAASVPIFPSWRPMCGRFAAKVIYYAHGNGVGS
ncbi:hypothetical protein HBI56_024170 [Parastagonospora nodorum]|uniref:Uncharacterized protein n=1 Tax=Phaeosphaeria nodorum (strain SN15 / ATCC MYA-4574 / FGSC 10173) TaxID=321614 RepID=A0A7U2F4W6_PHANO|nr:hypothetical protein HBH56_024330 [Parastagonospora nodorum]QRC98786.1 hypothetical protein JI435_412540 [Parastagonospora nodorum SN15]KAH3934482.1 hypothetical protein HBH54_057690 [Parastagonospora nodorum]KAH3949954.1 hypothetical protein HBH53_085380 [Parastagonospora nodorum]KAH3975947.1 hypothetical protein HBH51_079990 [Parastagonospora nodorum]